MRPLKSKREKTRSVSTSKGRANLARALSTTEREKTIVGFDRYRRPVAALVPIDAVYMLAGQDGQVTPAVRDRIGRVARAFVFALSRTSGRDTESAAAKPKKAARKAPRKKAARAAKKTKGKAKRKPLGKASANGV